MMQMIQMMMEDREAERAERQANIAALQQIAQNNQGHGNHDHPGSKLKNFQNTNPPMFSKTEEPLDADDWLQTMENNLEVAGVEAAEKVLFATHYLSGPARAWWTSARAMNAGQMMTWEDFKLKFSKYHVPQGLIKKMRDEFRELKQGRMSVVEYRGEERTQALRQEINYVVAHSLHRHSESLVNTLERVALRVVQEIMERRYSPSGPVLGTHQGEMQLHTRPPLPYAMAAPQQQGSPAYVVYKVGGDPGDYQFLHDPPKEIPHGYVCTFVPDCNNWTQAIQAPPGGIAGAGAIVPAGRTTAAAGSLGAEAEKQAWLAKYATTQSMTLSHYLHRRSDQCSLERPVRHPAEEEDNRLFQAVPQ
ncbi:hypothetical protein QYE76_064923 [Lolium multiflorum]|uniref:Retrotransposon gag domain-containing protein n=1 Tax=Lolium multiflorum TaxID=4521 RepID=A0AAD8W8D7_LOLMU|nr:hypothetical protein QYE76_064923 [Lolium multiflorum]